MTASAEEIVGTIVLSVNGKEFDCASAQPKNTVGRKLVSSMNRSGKAHLVTKTTSSIALSIEVYVDTVGDFDWSTVEDAIVSIETPDGSKRDTYTGVYVETVSESYGEGSEAKRSLECFAIDHIKE